MNPNNNILNLTITVALLRQFMKKKYINMCRVVRNYKQIYLFYNNMQITIF